MGADVVLLVALIAAAGAGSLLLGQDVNWDLQNYHYYNPWAWWHGRVFTKDLAAAQIQTFLNPLLDLPFYWMVTAEWAPRVIAFVMAIPAAIAAFFLCKLLLLMFGDLPRAQRMVAVASSLAIGVTSAMAIGELGSTMNEWPLAALLMLALWLIGRALKRAEVSPLPMGTLLLAGVIAVGGRRERGERERALSRPERQPVRGARRRDRRPSGRCQTYCCHVCRRSVRGAAWPWPVHAHGVPRTLR